MPPDLRGAPKLFQSILSAASSYKAKPARQFRVTIPDVHERTLWQRVHNRNIYSPDVALHPLANIVNPAINFQQVEDDYFKNAAYVTKGAKCDGEDTGGWAIVDNAFESTALRALQTYLTESTFYYFSKFGGHYLSSLFQDGMSAPLVAQVAQDLRRKFPRILGKHPLSNAWAFKFDNALNGTAEAPGKQVGVGVHADSAAVNLNFWPIEANESDTGGLTLYMAGAPGDMAFKEFNDPKYLKHISESAGKQEVEYRTNRLVIFNSNLLHETGQLHFGPGFKRRRINLTLLFGKRCSG